MFSANSPSSVANRAIALTISVDQPSGYNVFTAAGSPSDAVDVTVTINSGIRVSEMRALSFAPGSRIFIINNGKIYGAGGAGSTGASITAGRFSGPPYGTPGNGTDALQSNCRLIINNLNGVIYGGGGGGGGGRAACDLPTSPTIGCGAGGGGGGQGYPGGAGGFGGFGFSSSGLAGSAGSDTLRGSGVGGGTSGSVGGGWGSAGGIWGDSGSNDESGVPPSPVDATGGSPQSGGNPGRAIYTNGAGITWISGSSNVAGTVS